MFAPVISYQPLMKTFPTQSSSHRLILSNWLFGMRYTGQSFQRLIDSVTRGSLFHFACTEDWLVTSSSVEEVWHLRLFVLSFATGSIVNNGGMSELRQPLLHFFRHVPDANRIRALPSKLWITEGILNRPQRTRFTNCSVSSIFTEDSFSI